jgi:hypothetical protein
LQQYPNSQPDILTRGSALLNSWSNFVTVTNHIIDSEVSMMWVIDVKQVASLLSVVLTSEQHVDFFEWDMLGFWDEEPDEEGETDVCCHEEEERIAATYQRSS